jgi:hypothetical protein
MYKEMFNILSHKKMQIKTILSFCLTSVKLAIIKTQITMQVRMMGKKTKPHILLVEASSSGATIEISMKKPKNRLFYDPATSLFGIFLKECKSTYKTDVCTMLYFGMEKYEQIRQEK